MSGQGVSNQERAQPTLWGAEVLLRPLHLGDVCELWLAGQAEDIGRYTSIAWPFTLAAAELLIAEAQSGWLMGAQARFAIIADPGAANERLVGTASLLHIYPDRRDAEVAYWLGQTGRGRGLARRAVELLCDWAFAALALDRLHLMVDLDNSASHAVAHGCGFVPIGQVFWSHPTDRSKDGTCTVYERLHHYRELAGG